jgi:hypothetical protein
MATMVKEERYIFRLHGAEHELRVQELVWGSEVWPERFRVELPAPDDREAVAFYGATGREAVERAAEYLLCLGHAQIPAWRTTDHTGSC